MTVTIIGCGKMGCAMVRGLLKSGLVSAQDLVITNRSGTVPQALEGFSGLRFGQVGLSRNRIDKLRLRHIHLQQASKCLLAQKTRSLYKSFCNVSILKKHPGQNIRSTLQKTWHHPLKQPAQTRGTTRKKLYK